jgi:hypothetical protein
VEKRLIDRQAVEEVLKGTVRDRLKRSESERRPSPKTTSLSLEKAVLEARELEEEYSGEVFGQKPANQQQQQQQKEPTEMELLMQLIAKLDARMDKMETTLVAPSKNSSPHNKKSTKCSKCQEEGHLYFACRKDANMEIKCHNCGKVGHIARGCRSGNDE